MVKKKKKLDSGGSGEEAMDKKKPFEYRNQSVVPL